MDTTRGKPGKTFYLNTKQSKTVLKEKYFEEHWEWDLICFLWKCYTFVTICKPKMPNKGPNFELRQKHCISKSSMKFSPFPA